MYICRDDENNTLFIGYTYTPVYYRFVNIYRYKYFKCHYLLKISNKLSPENIDIIYKWINNNRYTTAHCILFDILLVLNENSIDWTILDIKKEIEKRLPNNNTKEQEYLFNDQLDLLMI